MSSLTSLTKRILWVDIYQCADPLPPPPFIFSLSCTVFRLSYLVVTVDMLICFKVCTNSYAVNHAPKWKWTKLHQFCQSMSLYESIGHETVPNLKLGLGGGDIIGYLQLAACILLEWILSLFSSEDFPGCGSCKWLWCHRRTFQVWGKCMTWQYCWKYSTGSICDNLIPRPPVRWCSINSSFSCIRNLYLFILIPGVTWLNVC